MGKERQLNIRERADRSVDELLTQYEMSVKPHVRMVMLLAYMVGVDHGADDMGEIAEKAMKKLAEGE